MSARGPVEVRIEQLVLTGFDARAGELVGRSLRSELERLIAGGEGWPAVTTDRALVRADARVDAGARTSRVGAGASAEATGRAMALAVYEELGG